MNEPSFPERVILTIARHRSLDRWAMRALLKANELLGLALGVRLAALRDSGEPLPEAFAQAETNLFLARSFEETSRILASRLAKIPDKRRPQYTPELRYRILRLKKLLSWSNDNAADWFCVAPGTISRWERESRGEGEAPPTLVRTKPPVRRFADVVRELVHTMRLAGFGGYDTIALTLARAGARISSRTVARILKDKPPPKSVEPRAHTAPRGALRARFPNDIFLVDLTDVASLFGIFRFKLALILDAFSRFPVAACVFRKEPSADEVTALLRHAMRRHSAPRHLVTDQGNQLTAEPLQAELRRLGIQPRTGAVGKAGSIALIERLWRTLKAITAVRSFPPLTRRELEARCEVALQYYAFHRPHQSLDGATPAELYFGIEPAPRRNHMPLPRGRPGEGPHHPLLHVEFLDPERRLPLLTKAA
jgi:putative transposase